MDAEESFRAYVRDRVAALSRIAFLLTGDRQHAEDLVQETLLRVVGRWARVVAGGDPDAYVRKVLYHQHVSAWRRQRGRVEELRQPPERAGRDEADAVADSVAVRAALAQLAPRQRAVLVLRYFEDLTEAQTADVLGCRIGTVKSNARDALARLRVIAPRLLSDLDTDDRQMGGASMTQELARRLACTADEMPAARVPEDLWRRGMRRHRIRRAVAAGAAAVVIAIVTALSGLVILGPPAPHLPADSGPAALPGRLHEPWPWQATVADNPAGPAVALVSGGGAFGSLDLPWTFGSHITVVGRDGSYRMLRYATTYQQAGQQVLLSPDGRFVAADGSFERLLYLGGGAIGVVDLTTGKQRLYPGEGSAVPVAWSPDGQRLLIRRTPPGTDIPFNAVSSPYDGRDSDIVDGGQLAILDLTTGTSLPLLEYGLLRPGPAAFSPDGRTLAVQLGRVVELVDTSTAARRSLTNLPVGAQIAGARAYTTDGTGIAILSVAKGCTDACDSAARNERTLRLEVLDAADGVPRAGPAFDTFGGAGGRFSGWQRDGTAVVVRYFNEVYGPQGAAYDSPTAYREVSDIDLLALAPGGGTRNLLGKPADIVWDVDVAADVVTAGAFAGPAPEPVRFPLAPWAGGIVAALLGIMLFVTLVIGVVRFQRP